MMRDVTVILPVLNETWSLESTIDVLIAENASSLQAIILVIHPEKTIPGSHEAIAKLMAKYEIIKCIDQTLPYVGGAVREGFSASESMYTVLMACDLETDPHLVAKFISTIKTTDADIVCASRWMPGGAFSQYSRAKKICNLLFQKLFNLIYFNSLSDMTYGFRIYKTSIIKNIQWQCLTHEFFFETLLKPFLLGYKIIQIPAHWQPRQEGSSTVRLNYFVKYFLLGLRLRFMKKKLYATLPHAWTPG